MPEVRSLTMDSLCINHIRIAPDCDSARWIGWSMARDHQKPAVQRYTDHRPDIFSFNLFSRAARGAV